MNQTQTTVFVCHQLPKHHTVCINTFIIIHDAKKRLLSFLPVLESSDNFLNENDLISYGLVPLDFQQHVMMVLPKVEKHFYMNSNPLLRCYIHHQIVNNLHLSWSSCCRYFLSLPSLPSCRVGLPVSESCKVW